MVVLVGDVVVLALVMVASRLDHPPPVVLHNTVIRRDALDVAVGIDSQEATMCVAESDLPLLIVVLCFGNKESAQ